MISILKMRHGLMRAMKKFVLILLFLSFRAHAETLTWQQVVLKAKEQNAELLEQMARLRAVEATEDAAVSPFLPQVSASASGNRSEQNSSGAKDSISASLNLRYNLFAGFADLGRLSRAKEQTLIARLQLRQTLADVSAQLKESFSNFSYAKSLVSLNRQIVERRSENMRTVELRYESGRENKGSVLLSKAYYEEAQLNVSQSELLVKTYRMQLATLLGYSQEVELDVVGDIAVEVPKAEPHFEELASKMPLVQQAEADLRVAKYDYDISLREGFLPSLDFSSSAGKMDTKFYPEENEQWNAGLTLTIPLFNGGRDYYGVKSAGAQKVTREYARDRVFRAALVSLRDLFASYKLIHQKVAITENFKEAASTRGMISRGKYNNGLMSFEDWDNVENELIQRERAYLEAKKESVVVESRWEKALGESVFDEK